MLSSFQLVQRNLLGKAVDDIAGVAKEVFELSQKGPYGPDCHLTVCLIVIDAGMAHQGKTWSPAVVLLGDRLVQLLLVKLGLGKRAGQGPAVDVAFVAYREIIGDGERAETQTGTLSCTGFGTEVEIGNFQYSPSWA